MSSVQPIDNFSEWMAGFSQPGVWTEAGALAACIAVAWALVVLLRKTLGGASDRSIWFGRRLIDGALFPMLLLCLAYLARGLLLKGGYSLVLFKVAIPVLMALLIIRVGVKVMQAAFEDAPWVRVIERTISWMAWLGVVLWVGGLMPLVLAELDQVTWKIGSTTLSVRTLIEGALTAVAVLFVTLWVSAAIEARLLRSATGGELSLRKAVANATRALMIFVALIVSLSAVGIDLTALSVLGGAIGVGIGFGLQKLAANYVSGFVILAEQSMRIGDMVRVDNFEGRVTDINARYTVIRALTGRESIVPNETLITSRVENLSLADPRVWQNTQVSVAYDSDVEKVSELLLAAARAQPRVLTDPGPAVQLANFGADGLEFTLSYWIDDPENGQANLKSDINLAVLRSLRANGIEIPYPQRVIHTRG